MVSPFRLLVFVFSWVDLYNHFRNGAFYDLQNQENPKTGSRKADNNYRECSTNAQVPRSSKCMSFGAQISQGRPRSPRKSRVCLARRGLICTRDRAARVQESCSQFKNNYFRRNVKRFRGGLVFKAHRLVYHATLGLRVIKKKVQEWWGAPRGIAA